MNELVSVIVPVFKVEPYLAKCIESIICQTYENLVTDLRIVVRRSVMSMQKRIPVLK